MEGLHCPHSHVTFHAYMATHSGEVRVNVCLGVSLVLLLSFVFQVNTVL